MKEQALIAQLTIILLLICDVILGHLFSLIPLALWVRILVRTYNTPEEEKVIKEEDE